mmetsp:Transcript_13632/g.22483  ORF Transcript_13632/g.22483 Transcript_13632/m.22483 type:complete len:86 (-) Transcript_13632:986-1243(-)
MKLHYPKKTWCNVYLSLPCPPDLAGKYSTDIGVYDTACKTLAYSRSATSVTVPWLSRGQKAHIIFTSSNEDECGRSLVYVQAMLS